MKKNTTLAITFLLIILALIFIGYAFWNIDDQPEVEETEEVEVVEEEVEVVEEAEEEVEETEEVEEAEEEVEETEEVDMGDLPVDDFDSVNATTTVQEAEVLAKNWIRGYSPTYRERSPREGLELVNEEEVEEGRYKITYRFSAAYDGYGVPEEDEELVEVDETKEMVAYMYYDLLLAVVVDENYDDVGLQWIGEDFEPFSAIDGSDESDTETIFLEEDQLPDNWKEIAEVTQEVEREDVIIRVYEWRDEETGQHFRYDEVIDR